MAGLRPTAGVDDGVLNGADDILRSEDTDVN